MEIELGLEVINSYKRLSYTAWYALAEFVDNSTQAYFDSPELQNVLDSSGRNLEVRIEAGTDSNGDYVRIIDNSTGMSKEILEQAVVIGKQPQNTSGRSKYGLGMKTAACWLGDFWTVTTKMIHEDVEHYIEVNVPVIASGNKDLNYQTKAGTIGTHYTQIEIRNLHRNLRAGKTSAKIRNFLSSMYRLDIENKGLILIWQGERLKWDRKTIESRLIKRIDGSLEKETFSFPVGGKTVTGWAGVFEKGSRRDAGFSIIQSNRVILGWPDSYRPDTIFGTQEGGSNDLVNQRLVGELYMDGFDVSHTKDEILFENDELDELESKLLEKCFTLRKLALSYRKYQADERQPTLDDTSTAINEFEIELNSNEVKDFLRSYDVPELDLIKESNETVQDSVMKKIKPVIKANLGEVEVWLYVVSDMSPYEPYVIIESTKSKSLVIVIVNKAHPHWKHLTGAESILNFLRHCTYDGVAEWKAFYKSGRIDPDTIKLIKDNLLRVPFQMTN
jgi:hypothetical protein